jgi:hypothetical protein
VRRTKEVGKRDDPLQTQEDMRHERAEWVVQRVGRVIMAVFVAAAAAGLFGSGPLAERHQDGISFDRFARRESPTSLDVELDATRRVWLGAEVLEQAEIERVTPEPVEVAVDGRRLVYRFDGAGTVQFALLPHRIGPQTLRVGRDGEHETRLVQMVFP